MEGGGRKEKAGLYESPVGGAVSKTWWPGLGEGDKSDPCVSVLRS